MSPSKPRSTVSLTRLHDGLGRIPPAGYASRDLRRLDKGPGNLVRVELWKDDAPRTVEMPEVFVALLKRKGLTAAFERLSLTRRKEYRNWIETAKREETLERRMAKALVWLRAELPQELS